MGCSSRLLVGSGKLAGVPLIPMAAWEIIELSSVVGGECYYLLGISYMYLRSMMRLITCVELVTRNGTLSR